jgi:RNA polymerase sigma-70 factor, ECF subfamily
MTGAHQLFHADRRSPFDHPLHPHPWAIWGAAPWSSPWSTIGTVVAGALPVYLLVQWGRARVDSEAVEAAEVMGRYCRGETAAFHRLYALLAPRLLAYLFGLLRDRAAAEDTLQVTFLKVHEARSTYVMGANPIPWMYTIAHRTCLDEIRKRKRNRVQLTKEGVLQTEPAADLTGVPVEAGQDEAARPDPAATAGALAALDQLPENQRQALLLTKVHGRSTIEAAMIEGTTPGAIKQRAHRAYVTLRGLLGKPDADASAPRREPRPEPRSAVPKEPS